MVSIKEETYSIINVVVVFGGGGCAPAAAASTVVNLSQFLFIARYNNIGKSSRSTCFPVTCPAVQYVLIKLCLSAFIYVYMYFFFIYIEDHILLNNLYLCSQQSA